MKRLIAAFYAWRERRAFRRICRDIEVSEQYMRDALGTRDVEGGKLPPGMWD